MGRADTLWLDISDEEESCVIRQTYRLRTLIQSLPAPSDQTPTLALFFESPERTYFPASQASGVHLRLDPQTERGQHPLLVASTQSLLSHRPSRINASHECGDGSIVQERVFPRSESLSVLPRLLLPFVDVVCFACVNMSDLRVVEAHVNQWILAWGWDGTGTRTPMPGMVVLLAEQHPLQPATVQRQLAKRLPAAKISVVRIDDSTWALRGVTPIRERLGQAAVRAWRWKVDHHLRFSGWHLLGLFEESFGNASRRRPFRYVDAARSAHPVASDLAKHLNNYVQALPPDHDEDFVAESIASACLVDHFTPGMHGAS